MQELNPEKEKATNAQIMFLVLNTSGLTLIPISVMALRASEKAANPSDIFLPILLATTCSSLAGLIIVSIIQKINLFKPVVLAYLLGIIAFVVGMLFLYTKHASVRRKGKKLPLHRLVGMSQGLFHYVKKGSTTQAPTPQP